MNDQLDHLKVHRIPPADTSKGKRHLPISGAPPPTEVLSGEVAEYAAGHEVSLPVDRDALTPGIQEAFRSVYDPEIPVNIFDLGLIYGFEITDEAEVIVRMTLTAPACPVAGALVQQVAEAVGRVENVARARVRLVWEPAWTQDRMTEEAMLELGLL